MVAYWIVISAIGLLAGSFLSMCIYRIPREETITAPPHCMECGKRLKPSELIPVASYVVLKGKCSGCGGRISVRYPVVELMTAAVYLLLFSRYGMSVEFAASAFLMTVLTGVFFIDIDHRIIPDELVLCGILGGALVFVYNFFKPFSLFGDRHWWTPLLGIPAGAGFLFVTAVVGLILYKSDDAMGMGDVKIFIPIGLFLGWKLTIVALIAAVFLGGFASVILLLSGIKKGKSTIPFGPFIVAGAFTGLMWGWDIINLYLGR